MKKNGFTLIELLAVLAILGMLTIMAVPSLMDLFSEKKEKLYESTFEEIERFAGVYLNDNPNLYINIEQNGYIDIQIGELCNGKYLNCPVSDPRDNSEIKGYVRINKTTNKEKYTYQFIRENDKRSEGFAKDSWSKIIMEVRKAQYEGINYPYQVGDTRKIDLGDLGEHTIRVSNVTPCDDSLESQTACGFVLEFVDVIEKIAMNDLDTNEGGWPQTKVRKYLNGTVYSAFPEELRNGIIEIKVVSSYGQNDTSNNFVSSDKLYLLSTMEVFGSILKEDTTSDINITRQLDYYKKINVTPENSAGATKTYGQDGIFWWWLRSAIYKYNTNFYNVDRQGTWNHYFASVPGGVSPAFRIG